MKPRVAVLQFPGINSEYETLRALWEAGIDADFFRWNQSASALNAFDGFVIPGGFSYEDRGRSGLIASMDLIMQEIIRQADQGKPVLGICNGAQILVESGLIPGGQDHELLMSLARNKRVKDGEILGVGFYNENIYVRCEAPCAFTWDYEGGEVEQAPVAHGEGRFTTSIHGLLEKLQENQQIVFRYCTKEGKIDPNFPTNPNGAMDNIAAICNPRGNVMAIMPHPERAPSAPMPKIFSSMRKVMEARQADANFDRNQGASALLFAENKSPLATHIHSPQTIELYVQLKITDNEAQTLENTLHQHGFDVHLQKWTHYEVEHTPDADQMELANHLIASGELLNPNKETVKVIRDSDSFSVAPSASYFLVRDREDNLGASKTSKIHAQFGTDRVQHVHQGTVWEVTGIFDSEKLLATNIFANPHAQILWSLDAKDPLKKH